MNKFMFIGGMINWSAVSLNLFSVDKGIIYGMLAVGTVLCTYGLVKGLQEINKEKK